jgi:hypothetical protein
VLQFGPGVFDRKVVVTCEFPDGFGHAICCSVFHQFGWYVRDASWKAQFQPKIFKRGAEQFINEGFFVKFLQARLKVEEFLVVPWVHQSVALKFLGAIQD